MDPCDPSDPQIIDRGTKEHWRFVVQCAGRERAYTSKKQALHAAALLRDGGVLTPEGVMRPRPHASDNPGAARLAGYAFRREITQRDFARQLGVCLSTLWKYRRGFWPIPADILQRLGTLEELEKF